MSAESHAHTHRFPVTLSIITVSDTRTLETDTSGQRLQELAEAAGHRLLPRLLVHDEPKEIEAAVDTALGQGAEAIIFTGGTGISRRDITIETLRSRLSKELPGFGEFFRMLSWQEIGSAALLSRCLAGVIGNAVVFALPGSRKAVELAMKALILPEVAHMVWEIKRQA